MRFLGFVTACCLFSSLTEVLLAKESLVVLPDHSSGVYAPGESVVWTIGKPKDATTQPIDLSYQVLQGGLTEIASGSIKLDSNPLEVKSSRKEPGTLLLSIKWKDSSGKEMQSYGGAVFAPEKIAVSSQPPEDFDEFWASKIAELDAVPMDTQLERVDIGDDSIEYYKITMNNVRGRKIYGQLAKPVKGDDFPALLQVQWAGVYPLNRDWIRWQAKSGWLVMNISAHDLPIDQPEAFYAEKSKKELDDYPGQGNDDRETSYFLPMFLSCRRAVDYLTSRSDWNHQTMVVHGGSQGGYQSIVTAGIHPGVTAFAASVPAGCDHTGAKVGRAPGWPNWASRTWQGKNAEKMLNTSRYFDAMNFASRTKAPALVGIGLIDTVCPAEGSLATFNAIKSPKQLVIMPLADHGGDHHAYSEAFNKFLETQKKAAAVAVGQ